MTETLVKQYHDEEHDGYLEATYSILDDRYPIRDNVTRMQINLKAYKVWTITQSAPAPVKGSTAVMFYYDLVQGEIDSYEGLSEEIVEA